MSLERRHSDPVPATNEPQPGQEDEQAQKRRGRRAKHSNAEPSSTVVGEHEDSGSGVLRWLTAKHVLADERSVE